MQFRIRGKVLSSILAPWVVVLSACGGGQAEPETAASQSPEPEKAAAEAAPAEEKAPEAAKSEKKDEPPAKPERTAKDILMKPDVLYVFSFASSEPHQVAEKKCKEKSKDDPKKNADCMTAAGKQMDDQDSYSFQEDGEGKLWWVTIQRKAGKLTTLHKIPIEFGDATADKVTLKPHGPDAGSKPMGAIPKELIVEVPSESEIAITDPKLGRLVYEAKLGILGKQDR
jgi:hypothetical protein